MQNSLSRQASAEPVVSRGLWAKIRSETARAFTLYFEYCALVAESRARRTGGRTPR